MNINEKLLECKSVKDFETLIMRGRKFTSKECIQIDNAVETSSFITDKDFDKLYILLSENHNYNSALSNFPVKMNLSTIQGKDDIDVDVSAVFDELTSDVDRKQKN